MIDEDAGELIADRLVDQQRGDGRIDAAREPADHAALADLRADARDFAGAELRHGPVARAAGDAMDEIGEQRRAVRRVHHLGVELHAVEAARSSAMAAKGAPFEMPTARKPGGSRVTRSPWLIHTGARSPTATRRRTAASRR